MEYKKIWDIPEFDLANMVYAGFRDASCWDIQGPPLAQSDPGAAPNPNDEEHLDARPDQEEMEEAINKFLLQLEKQEKKGFKDLANILSQLPKPAQGSVRSISVADAIEAGFLPAMDEDQADCSLCLSFACTDTLRTTG